MHNVARHLPKMYVRNPTTKRYLELLDKLQPKVLIETGTTRKHDWHGDGCSSVFLGQWADDNGAILHTVDISPENIEVCKTLTKGLPIEYHVMDSVKFLQEWQGPIDFLYLDSYDCDLKNPEPSYSHCFSEYLAAKENLHDKSILVIDDTIIDIDPYTGANKPAGKGATALPKAISDGWILDCIYRQAVFTRRRY